MKFNSEQRNTTCKILSDKMAKENSIEQCDETLAKIGINTKYIYGKRVGEYKSLNQIIEELVIAFKILDDNAKTQEEIESNEIIKNYTIRKLFGIKDMSKISYLIDEMNKDI